MLCAEQKAGLNVALNEATLLGAEVDPARPMAALTLSVLTLPAAGPAPQDDRVQLVLYPVGRVAASLRARRWDDAEAEVVPFDITELLAIVRSFKLPIYGWEFFDQDEDFRKWENRLSVDCRLGDEGMSQSITLFQEGHDRHLDLRIWFDLLRVNAPTGRPLDLDEFVAGGNVGGTASTAATLGLVERASSARMVSSTWDGSIRGLTTRTTNPQQRIR